MNTKQIADIYRSGLKLIEGRIPSPPPPKAICYMNNNIYEYENGKWVKLWK